MTNLYRAALSGDHLVIGRILEQRDRADRIARETAMACEIARREAEEYAESHKVPHQRAKDKATEQQIAKLSAANRRLRRRLDGALQKLQEVREELTLMQARMRQLETEQSPLTPRTTR